MHILGGPKKDRFVVLGGGGMSSSSADGENIPTQRQNPLLRLLIPNHNSRNWFIN